MMTTLLVNVAVKATLLLLTALGVSIALRRASAAARHLVWTAAIAGIAILPLLELALPRLDVEMEALPAAQVVLPESAHGEARAGSVTPVSSVSWVPLVWSAGALIVLARLLAGSLRVLGWIRNATPFRRPSNGARVLISNQVSTPLVWGWVRPVILLPAAAEEWPVERLTMILEHERTHIRRKDWLTQMLAQFACALYWFHPLVWWSNRQLRKEREHACDDAVLLSGAARTEYAEHLLYVARSCQADGGAVAMAEPSMLESRLRSILDPERRRMLIAPRLAAAAAALALCVIVPLAAIRARAQGPATLAGIVQDASGARVPSAEIMVSIPGAGRREIAKSDAAGEYSISGLPAGPYRLEVRRPGFMLFRRDGELQDGVQRLDVALEVGAVSERLEIVGKGQRAPDLRLSNAPPQRIRVGGNVQATRLLQSPRPVYPDTAKAAGIEGTVLLDAVISKEGRLIGLRTANTSAHPDLVKAAQDAVSQWIYQPTLLNGQPVEVITTITVNFRLEP